MTDKELIDQLKSGDAETAMEAAKAIIAGRIRIPRGEIEKIADGFACKDSARIAAIYLLGNIRAKRSAGILARILQDKAQKEIFREYAAEALGNIGDSTYLPLLSRIAAETSSPEIRHSCEFALEEIPEAEARRARSV